MRATAQDREAAQLMGIDINTTIALTFLIGSALAGAAGFVSGVYYGTTWFFNGFSAGLKAFTAAVLGGIGNLAGAMVGGFLIGLIEAMATQLLPSGAQWSNVVVFSVLVLVLIFRPSGLLGESLPNKV
jgi:branched-chain amino acid transport system permease protein